MRTKIRQLRAWRRSCAARLHIDRATVAVAEALERRTLLSALVVSTVADELDGDYSAGDLSLREALAAARTWPGADTITFDLPAHSTILTGGSVLTIDSDVALLGPGADQLTVDGQRLGPHTFLVTGDITVAMSGLRISGGGTGSGTSDWEAAGGGIANKDATLLVRDCTFTGNGTIVGGGLSNLNGTLDVVGCLFEGNGGAGAGGAIANYFGTLNVTQSVIRRNYTSYYAAAAWNYEGTLNMSNVAVSGNVGNTGSIHNVRGNASLVNCTVTGNSAAGWGGGGIENSDGTVELQNTITARHGGMGDLEGSFDPASSHNLIGAVDDTSTGIVAGVNGNLGGTAASPLDPLFVRNPYFDDPVDYGDLHPQADSPAVNAGDSSLLPPDTHDLDGDGNTTEPLPLDLGGDPRVGDAVVDIGAYERRSSVAYLSDLTPTSVVNGWGAYERDRSNGEAGPADGRPITLNGTVYAKGLGVHAYSSLKYDLAGGGYTRFQSNVGVDDEVGNYGSVIFQVYLDNVLAWQSGTMYGSSATAHVDIPVAGKSTLELRVMGTGDGVFADHADWAGARLLSSSVPDTTPPTPNPSGWAVWPTAIGHDAIRMEAAAATDPSGVLYYFESLTTAFTVAESSGWQESPVWVDTGLTPGMVYGYRVRTCDKSPAHNTTGWSSLGTANTSVPPSTQYLSDLTPATTPVNGWGDYERDRSNGEAGAADGHRITLNGVGYDKGLGVHAQSSLKYNLTGLNKTRFKVNVGVDDEVKSGGSVIFEVWLDGVLAKSTPKMTRASATESIEVDITGKTTLELRVTGAGDGIAADHADWANALLDDGAVSAPQTVYLSDLVPGTKPVNGFGDYERDRSNGNAGPNDGKTITLNGQTYAKGLGVHADSVLTYSLIGRNATRFQSDIGIDDEVGNLGSVVFQVWLDGAKVYDSGRMTGVTATKKIDLQIAGKSTLELRVTGAGDGYTCDHADWAGARLVKVPAIATIRGTVWRDFDADGEKDANDSALPGQRVYLDTVPNSRYDAGEPSVLSAADGSYAFTSLTPGEYTARVEAPEGWKATIGQHDVSLFPGDNTAGQDFLLAAPNEAPTVNAGADQAVTLGANGLATINLNGASSDDGQPGEAVLSWEEGSSYYNIVNNGVFAVDVPQYFNSVKVDWDSRKYRFDVHLVLANRMANGGFHPEGGIRIYLEEKLVDQVRIGPGQIIDKTYTKWLDEEIDDGIEVDHGQLTLRLQQDDADAQPYAAISKMEVFWHRDPGWDNPDTSGVVEQEMRRDRGGGRTWELGQSLGGRIAGFAFRSQANTWPEGFTIATPDHVYEKDKAAYAKYSTIPDSPVYELEGPGRETYYDYFRIPDPDHPEIRELVPFPGDASFPDLNGVYGSRTDHDFYEGDRLLSYGWHYQPRQAYWHVLDGPGTVTFADPYSATTTATFSESGIYNLERWSADGELQDVDTVKVTVSPARGLAIGGLTLLNASAAPIRPLRNGTLIDYAVLGTQDLGVRAGIGAAGRVEFALDGPGLSDYVLPNADPVTTVLPPNLLPGHWELTATAYSPLNSQMIAGEPTKIYFDVVDSASDAYGEHGLTAIYYPGKGVDIYTEDIAVEPWTTNYHQAGLINFDERDTNPNNNFPEEARTVYGVGGWHEDTFYASYTGQIQVDDTISYQFVLEHAEGDQARLWIDDKPVPVIDTFSSSDHVGYVDLDARRHDIRVEFLHLQDSVPQPYLKLLWTNPNAGNPDVVPIDNLYRSAETRMAWWRQARFGMYIHLGLYSTLAGEWKGTPTPGYGAEWIRRDLEIPEKDFHLLQDQFDLDHFDAKQWVSLAKRAGMEYIIITTKHHEGWNLYDSADNDYDLGETPFGQAGGDVIQDLVKEAHAQGLHVGMYYSVMDWDHELWRGWRPLTSVHVDEDTLRVTLRKPNGVTGALVADAVRIRRADDPDGKWIVIDDGDPSYGESYGEFKDNGYAPAAGYQQDYRISDSSGSEAYWEFTGLAPGFYDVEATWQSSLQDEPDRTQSAFFLFSGRNGKPFPNYVGPLDQTVHPGTDGNHTQPDEYVSYMKSQLATLLARYPEVEILWPDMGSGYTPKELSPHEIVNYLREELGRPDLIIGDRIGLDNDIDTFRESKPLPANAQFWDWEYPMTTNRSWGYKASDHDWKTSTDIIRWLAGTVSKGGNVVLNVGPTGQGLFPLENVKILDQVGDWLRANGESIYGAGASGVITSGPVATARPGRTYLHITDWQSNPLVTAGLGARAHVLAHPGTVVPLLWAGGPGKYEIDLSAIPLDQRDPADTVIVLAVD